jgi:hemerythrin-like domain-containing protein
MNRFNIFYQIHKGLRAMLYDMALTMQHTDFCNQEEGRATLRKLRQVLNLYAEHGQHEEAFVFPAVHQASPAVVALLESEHEKDEQLTNDLLLQTRSYRIAATENERAAVGYDIQLSFQEFVAFNLQHMCKEERNINPLLWESYSDEEIMEIQKQIRSKVSPESEIQITRWILRGMSDGELTRWFGKVKETAPQEVWNGLWLIAIDELGYEKVAQLSHEQVAAPVY